jgi:hypothetical protein
MSLCGFFLGTVQGFVSIDLKHISMSISIFFFVCFTKVLKRFSEDTLLHYILNLNIYEFVNYIDVCHTCFHAYYI